MSDNLSGSEADSDPPHTRDQNEQLEWVTHRRKPKSRLPSVPSHSRSPLKAEDNFSNHSNSDSSAIYARDFIDVFELNRSWETVQAGLHRNTVTADALPANTVSNKIPATVLTSTPNKSGHSSPSSETVQHQLVGGEDPDKQPIRHLSNASQQHSQSEAADEPIAQIVPVPSCLHAGVDSVIPSPAGSAFQRLDDWIKQLGGSSKSNQKYFDAPASELSSPDWKFFDQLHNRLLPQPDAKHVGTDCDLTAGSLQYHYSDLGLQEELWVQNNIEVTDGQQCAAASQAKDCVRDVKAVRLLDIVDLNGGYNWDSLCRQHNANPSAHVIQLPPAYPNKPSEPIIRFIDTARSAATSVSQPSNSPASTSVSPTPTTVQSVENKVETVVIEKLPPQLAPPLDFDVNLFRPVFAGVQLNRPVRIPLCDHKTVAEELIETRELKQQHPARPEQIEPARRRQLKISIPASTAPIDIFKPVVPVDIKSVLPSILKPVVPKMATGDSLAGHTNTKSMISDSIIAPKKFASEIESGDPEFWLSHFIKFVTFKQFSDADKIALFSMLLFGAASDWYSTLDLPPAVKFTDIVEKFKQNYYPSEELRWRETTDVWTTKQTETESVNAFLIRLKTLARRSKITEESLNAAFLNGLKPQIRLHCLQNGVTTLENTLRSARVAEASGIADPMTSLIVDSLKQQSVAVEQQSIQLKAMMDKVNALTIATNQSPLTVAPLTIAAGPTAAPDAAGGERRNYQSDRQGSISCDKKVNYQGGSYVDTRQTRRPATAPQRFNPQRQQRERYVQMHAQQFSQNPPQQQFAQAPEPQQLFQQPYQQQQQQRLLTPLNEVCSFCARQHPRDVRCPAKRPGITCHFCLKPGHFSAACRSVKRQS